MEEPPFLMAVQRVVAGVETENDLARRHPVGLKEEVDAQAPDRHPVVADLVIARVGEGSMLEPIQGAPAGQRRAAHALGPQLAANVASTGFQVILATRLSPIQSPEAPAP
jgi:hypothetical protein